MLLIYRQVYVEICLIKIGYVNDDDLKLKTFLVFYKKRMDGRKFQNIMRFYKISNLFKFKKISSEKFY